MSNAHGIMLSATDLAIASLLLLISAATSAWLRLGLGRQIAVAALRTVAQLSLIGFVLQWVFAADRWPWVMAIITAMTVVAGLSARGRSRIRYVGLAIDALVAVWSSSWLVTAIGLYLVLRVTPWYSPQFVIPILGMVLGNSLTAIALTLDRLTNELRQQRGRIEMMLSLGAPAWTAYRDVARNAVTAGMTPTLNSMMVVGLVSLPGMMTGQILAGGAPGQAVRYQIVILFLICASSSLGCTLIAALVFRRVFNARQQFCHERLALSRDGRVKRGENPKNPRQ